MRLTSHLMGKVSRYASIRALMVCGLLSGLFLCYSNALANDTEVLFLADYGNVTVMEVAGNLDANLPDGTVNTEPRVAIAKEFFRTHHDDYDFLVIFTNFDIQMPEEDVRGFYTHVKNDNRGIGLEQFDYSDRYGSDGRLQGTIDMGNLARHSGDPVSPEFEQTLYTLNHEVLHRWCANVSFLDENGQPSDALLGRDGSHWSYLLDTDGSLQYGNNWQDNGDGTYTAVETTKVFSPLDLYLMGMIGKDDVPPMTLIENPAIDPTQLPESGVTISGTARTVTIDDIIAVEGERVPGVLEAQKSFKAAFIIAVAPGSFNGQELFAIEMIRNRFLAQYSILTDGQGLIQVASDPLPNLPVNPGVALPTRVPRTLPANIEEGIDWLITHQDEDGSWSDSLQTMGRDTAEATTALKVFSSSPESIGLGADWLSASDPTNTDYLAREIESLATTGRDATDQIQTLLAWQNADGRWGSSKNFISNPIDTGLVLKALGRAGYANKTVTDGVIAYLTDRQNPDGGWGNDGPQSLIQPTAYAMLALQAYSDSYDQIAAIAGGIGFLNSKQNVDGGFGNSPSTVYDSSVALLALSEVGADLGSTRQAATYLENHQFPDGGWYDSPYQTAVALQALWRTNRDPDLAISSEDISFIPEQISKLPCETVVSVNVANLGRIDVQQATVRLYEGVADADHMLAEQTAAFPGLGDTTLTFPLSLEEGRTYSLIVEVDPEGEITELDKRNNRAGRTLEAVESNDFVIIPEGLVLSSNDLPQGGRLTITATINNAGTVDAYNVPVRFFIQDGSNEIEIAAPTVDLLSGKATSLEINWHASYSGESLQVAAQIDPNNLFAELDEANNQTMVNLRVAPSQLPNFVLASEPQFSPVPVLQDGDVWISVTLLNTGAVPANDIPVTFYQGSPEAGGVLLGETVVPRIEAGESLPVEFLWQPVDTFGEQLVVVRADSAGMIAEVDETDNQTLARLPVLSRPDLVISEADVFLEPTAPREGEPVKVVVNLYNQGDQDAHDITVSLDLNGQTFTQSAPLVAGNGWIGLEFDLGAELATGKYLLRVEADPANLQLELSEENNLVEISFGLQNADLWVSEPFFSPNGDGVKDATKLFYRFAEPQSLAVQVQSGDGQIVRQLSVGTESDVVDGQKLWDGRNDRGVMVPDGPYQVKLVSSTGFLLGSIGCRGRP